MRLTKIVPTLGLLAAAATPSMGVELANGTITIDGFVDVVGSYTEYGKGTPESLGRTSSVESSLSDATRATLGLDATAPTQNSLIASATGISETTLLNLGIANAAQADKEKTDIGFDVSGSFALAWRIGENVEALIDIDFDDAGNVTLDEAIISWQFADDFSLSAGQYINWLGWEAADAPDLYTVNQSIIYNQLTGITVQGGNIGWSVFADDEQSLDLAFHVVENIYGTNRRSSELSYALAGGYSNAAFGSLGFSLSYENPIDTYTGGALFGDISGASAAALGLPSAIGGISLESLLGIGQKTDDILGINVFAEVDVVDNWLFAVDVHFQDRIGNEALGVMGMANVGLPTPFPSSLTGMVSYLDVDFEDGAGLDDEWIEGKVAWLTNPTGSDNFGLNFELSYLTKDDSAPRAKNRDQLGFFVELLAIIP